MTKKTSQRRKQAFFAALAETGNQSLSAERAKVSRSWVSLHRAADPAFRAAMEAAIAAAAASLGARGAAQGMAPPSGWGDVDGELLVIRGTNRGRTQVTRARIGQWNAETEVRFLSALAASANIQHACRTAEVSAASAYVRRHRWRAFAARWDEALEIGHIRLEFALLENANNILEGGEIDYAPDMPIPPMSIDQAMQLMGQHRRRIAGYVPTRGRWHKVLEFDDVRASVMRKIEAIERHRDGEAIKRQEEALLDAARGGPARGC